MIVKILEPGRYLGKDLKAKVCKIGDQLETQEWYALKLIEKGKAEAVVVKPVPVKKTTKSKSSTKKSEKAPAKGAENPFLEP